MKKSSFLILALGVFTVFSCSENAEPEEDPQIEGEWMLQDAQVEGSGTVTVHGSSVPIPVGIEGEGEQYDLTLIFNENPATVLATGSFVFKVAFNASGLPLGEQELPIQADDIFSGTWAQVDDQLIFTDGDNIFELDIEELTENRMRLSGTPNFDDIEVENVTVTEASVDFSFIR
ncbi:MAG: hypothetical protein WDZ72_01780 [Cyclobacteriaceae bacterium]